MHQIHSEHILFGAKSLTQFVTTTKELPKTFVKEMLSQLKTLIKHVESKAIDKNTALVSLNTLIDETNKKMPEYPAKAEYPILYTENAEQLVATHIIAFEHYVHNQSVANHISLQDANTLFHDALGLWQKVMTTKSTPKAGVFGLIQLIEQANSLTAGTMSYPLPKPEKY